jgi:hypothetical protein
MSSKFELSSENFGENYSDILAFFDQDQVFNKIGSWLRLEGASLVTPDATVSDLESILEMGFVALVNRGALAPTSPLSDAAASRIDKLRRIYSFKKSEPIAAPAPEPVDDFSDIVRDQRDLSTRDLKMKLLSDKVYADRYEKWAQNDKAKREAAVKADFKARGWC